MQPKTALALPYVIAALAGAVPAYGQLDEFTISDGSTELTLEGLTGNRLASTGGVGNLRTGVGEGQVVDHLFQNWFWYRTDSDAREYAISTQTSGTASGNRARLIYTEPANDGNTPDAIRIEVEYTLSELSTGAEERVLVQIAFKLQNLTGGDLAVQLFSYNDFDLGGSAGDESALARGTASHVQDVTDDLTNDRGLYVASVTDHVGWGISTFPTLRGFLTDEDADDLSNSTSPFGPSDYTGANQWGATLAPAGDPQDTLAGSVVVEIERGTCPGDIAPLGGNGVVNFNDLLLLLSTWGECP